MPVPTQNFGPRNIAAGGFTFKTVQRYGLPVINKTGSDIPANSLVAITGFDVTSGRMKVVLANAGTAAYEDIYVTPDIITNAKNGFVYKGLISTATLNTNFGTAGDPIYADAAVPGGFTGTAPSLASQRVQPVGFTIVKSATVGQVYFNIGPTRKFSSNELQSGASQSAADGLTATGTTQTDALALTAAINRVTAGAAATGVKLPAAAAGLVVAIINSVTNSFHVYGAGTDTIDDVVTATGVIQSPNSTVLYYCTTSGAGGKWYSEGLGTGFVSSFQTLSFTPTITANATQTQAAATKLTTMVNRISVCATQGNGVALPPATVGMQIVVINRGAQPAQVYGDNTAADTINGIGTATGVSLGVNATAVFYCNVAGNWEVPVTQLWSTTPTVISANGAVPPHVAHTYAITKAGVAALTLAAPTTVTDDGLEITFISTTANAHTLTATGLLKTGSAFVNVATFNANAGASLTLMAYGALWYVVAANGVSFS